LSQVLAALSVLAAYSAAPGVSAADVGTEQASQPQQTQPAVASEIATPASQAPSGEQTATATSTETQQKSDAIEQSVLDVEPAAETKGADGGAAESAAEQDKEVATEKKPEPVTGAFGVPLGERFEPCMVAKIIGQEDKTYRGPDKVEQKGILYRVEPRVTNERFSAYSVETTRAGIIYAVHGDYESTDKQSKCDVTKQLAAFLEEKYGRPRGKGAYGEWYAFRDMSAELYRGVRLYANRCRRGIYSIIYSDDQAKTADAPSIPAPTETSGL